MKPTETAPSTAEADPLPQKYRFDPNDEFYLAPPMCSLLHYREGAVVAGLVEIGCLIGGVSMFANLHSSRGLIDLWTLLFMIAILTIACITTAVMVRFFSFCFQTFQFYGIRTENPKFLIPQITFLHFEIILLLLGSVGSIASMSLGIEWTNKLFAPFFSVHEMESNFGPIWPFNVAIICFTGAALGIWFHLTVQGCQDFFLDKLYFQGQAVELPLELQRKVEREAERNA